MVTVAVIFVRPFALIWSVSDMVNVRKDETRPLFLRVPPVELLSICTTLWNTWNRMKWAPKANWKVYFNSTTTKIHDYRRLPTLST